MFAKLRYFTTINRKFLSRQNSSTAMPIIPKLLQQAIDLSTIPNHLRKDTNNKDKSLTQAEIRTAYQHLRSFDSELSQVFDSEVSQILTLKFMFDKISSTVLRPAKTKKQIKIQKQSLDFTKDIFQELQLLNQQTRHSKGNGALA